MLTRNRLTRRVAIRVGLILVGLTRGRLILVTLTQRVVLLLELSLKESLLMGSTRGGAIRPGWRGLIRLVVVVMVLLPRFLVTITAASFTAFELSVLPVPFVPHEILVI